jgi:hypothetical protein
MDYEYNKKLFPEFVFSFMDLKIYEKETCRSLRGVWVVAFCVLKSILQRGKHRVHSYLSSNTSN